MKQIRETKAGKSISAYIVLNAKKEYKSTVQAHFADSGRVQVDVWNSAGLAWQGSAGGGGYDKFTAALAGADIDGIIMRGNSETSEATKLQLAKYLNSELNLRIIQEKKAHKCGMQFANWDTTQQRYTSLHHLDGLNALKGMGYIVIQAI